MNSSLKQWVWTGPLLLCALMAAMADVTTTEPATAPSTTHSSETSKSFGVERNHVSSSAKSGAITAQAVSQPTTRPAVVAPKRPPQDFYEPLIRKNIFLKQPGGTGLFTTAYKPMPAQTAPDSTRRGSGSAEASWILTGTALGVGYPAALIENSESGEVRRIKPGDQTVAGKVASIDMDGMNLQGRSGIKRILVGSSLDGNALPTTLPAASTQSNSGSGDGSPSEDAILERLKRRRAKEMGK